jgi:hypothetical protein
MRKHSDSAPAPAECANCGAAIPRGAKACPECGADERTGWRETDPYDGLDLPEEAFADERDQAATGGREPPRRDVYGVPWYWWCAGTALLVILILGALALLPSRG